MHFAGVVDFMGYKEEFLEEITKTKGLIKLCNLHISQNGQLMKNYSNKLYTCSHGGGSIMSLAKSECKESSESVGLAEKLQF